MVFSSGTRAFLGELASWALAAGLLGGTYYYFDDLKNVSFGLLGIPTQSADEAITQPEPSDAGGGSHGVVEIPAGANGHYQARIEVNGREIPVLVDTGATMVSLTFEDAETAGLFLKPSDFTRAVSTANGDAKVALITLERVSIGTITVRNVKGTVSQRGKLGTTLLGMSFLGRLERVDMRAGVLLLQD